MSDEKKKVSSTGGMENSVNTSKLLKHRADAVVAERVTAIEKVSITSVFSMDHLNILPNAGAVHELASLW